MKKSILIKSLVVLIVFTAFVACQQEKKKVINFPMTDLTAENLIPRPLKIIPTNSAFGLDKNTIIYTSQNAEGFPEVGEFLSEKIKWQTELDLAVNSTPNASSQRIIFINQSDSTEFSSKEGYDLYITQDSIILNAKKYIDILAYYKINTLHLHLTDDQGWRIEIKSWPKLTEIGGSSEVGGGPGGFYTQEEYKDIVAYAAKHFITIVPEVDMPGHTNAASVAYPILNGNGKTPKIYTGTEVGFSTFDANKDTVYAFIEDVVREISAITPGPYFHAGGDESHVTKKKDFIHFVSKVDKIVKKYGKKMIGWDEIVHADIDTSAIAQFWANEENAKLAVEKGLKVILSPGKKAYLDMKYDTLSKYGLNWAGLIPVDTGYVWTPERYVQGINKENILGIEAPLWSETVSNMDEVEYLAFPRMIGYSELSWSVEENRNWDNYKVRLGNQAPYLDKMNVKYYPSELIEWKKSKYTYKTIEKD